MDAITDWLKEYMAKGKELPEGIEQKNYFEAGLMDSFGVILLIEDVEKEFSITFNEGHFQDRRFPTMSGLAEIIHEEQNGSLQ